MGGVLVRSTWNNAQDWAHNLQIVGITWAGRALMYAECKLVCMWVCGRESGG